MLSAMAMLHVMGHAPCNSNVMIMLYVITIRSAIAVLYTPSHGNATNTLRNVAGFWPWKRGLGPRFGSRG